MKPLRHPSSLPTFAIALSLAWSGCSTVPGPAEPLARYGDEIVAAGEFFRIGTPVVLWIDPHGYDAYRVERRFGPLEESDWETSREAVPALRTPNRYGLRKVETLNEEQLEQVRGGGWSLPLLQAVVDQFVYHYDVTGTSRECFRILHDRVGLSVHFMLDLDGTIYQTLDLKERAWHATTSNTRSIGIEIANMGAYGEEEENPLDQWYQKDAAGITRITIPERLGDGGILTPGFIGRPVRNDPVTGTIQGRELQQYDLTEEQYVALAKLTAALCRIFPRIRCDYPRDDDGHLVTHKLPDDQLASYQGLIGHFHIQANKVDPGPAFQWDRVVGEARHLLEPSTRPRMRKTR
jgi:N-acetylmuramoyl-L-alanine amidase